MEQMCFDSEKETKKPNILVMSFILPNQGDFLHHLSTGTAFITWQEAGEVITGSIRTMRVQLAWKAACLK